MNFFKQTTLIGIGLIGSSIARALKKKNLSKKICIFSKTQNKYTLSIKSNNGKLVYKNDGIFDRGFNYIDYNLRYDKNDLKKSDDNFYYLEKGSYRMLISVNKKTIEKEFKI